MKTTTAFRRLLQEPGTVYICDARDALSARIVEEAGFPAIWASGLTISALAWLRDDNEATWNQVLDHLQLMSDAVTIPMLVDGDTCHNNFDNFQRLVRKLEQRGVAAVCIEDTCFPKVHRFLRGTQQPLSPIDEFSGKIKAGKDVQCDRDFTIIAGIEAFSAGWGLDEALRRAEAYHAAGADGVLIHSARSTPEEVLAFKKAWGDRCPVVIVPTKYYATPPSVLETAGFSIVIWANHILRSSIAAMRATAERLRRERSLIAIEDGIAPVSEVFRLQGEPELAEQEGRYLPAADSAQAIVLAASRGVALGELTNSRPKAMVPVGGVPLLQRIVDTYRRSGVQRFVVVRGYCASAVNLDGLTYVDNTGWAGGGELTSLAHGLSICSGAGDLFVSYGDVLFKRYVIEQLLDADAEWTVAVDTHWRERVNRDRNADYVHCSVPHGRPPPASGAELLEVGVAIDDARIHGEWMGFLRVAAARRADFMRLVDRVLNQNSRASMRDLLNALVAQGERVRVVYGTGNWLDIDSLDDLVVGGSF